MVTGIKFIIFLLFSIILTLLCEGLELQSCSVRIALKFDVMQFIKDIGAGALEVQCDCSRPCAST